MNKKLFLSMFAAAGMLLATSCSNDELDVVQSGNEAQVTFSLGLEGGIETRAISDGTGAKKLVYAVYKLNAQGQPELQKVVGSDEKGQFVDEEAFDNGLTETVEITLAKGQTYQVAFWAQNPSCTAYNTDHLTAVSVDYNAAVNNDELRDAFFKTEEFTVSGNKSIDVVLKRPFAQINVGVTAEDWDAAVASGIEIKNSSVVINNAANEINLLTGAVQGDAEVTYTLNGIPGEELMVDADGDGTKEAYKWLSMSYILVNDTHDADVDQDGTLGDYRTTLNSLQYTFEPENGNSIAFAKGLNSVPVQRNWRTNILGKILTGDVTFTIVIDAEFDGDKVVQFDGEKVVHEIFSAQDLQDVLNGNLAAGTYAFYLGADIAGDVTILQQEGVNIVIDGATHKWDGTVTINGDARYNGAETLTLKNINFVANSKKDFIHAPTKVNDRYNYSHNVTVDNCTFSSDDYNEEIVGIKLLTTYNAVVKNCTATNIHSLAQFQSTDNATVIENVKVVNCKNGISLGNMASATITNAEISANGYGVRLDGEKSREVAVTIENATIEAFIPVNVRKMNDDACKATVKFEGVNSLIGHSYEIAFCSNEYEDGVTPVAPKGTFTLDGAEAFRAYVGPISSASAFDAAINSSNGNVVVEGKIESVGTGFMVERDVVFDFQGNELNAGSTPDSKWYALQIFGDYNVEINNANFTRAGVYAADGADVVFNSGVIDHKPERTSRYIFCAQNGSTITVNNGTFKNDRARNRYFWADNSIIYVKGGNFGGVASEVKVYLSNGGQLIITGGTFNFDPSEWVAEGYAATYNGSTWTVDAE